MRIAMGNDHAGYVMREHVQQVLKDLGCEVLDFGTDTPDPVDFPDVAGKVCEAVRSGQADRGVMVCGTGVGACIAANKMPGIRAAVCHDAHSAHQCVEHDDVNVMCIGAQIVGPWMATDLITQFIHATFSTDEDFRRRVGKLHELELTAARELREQI